MNEKKLSIIIPCRNGEIWIPQVAKSIFSSDLKEEEYEIVFVDDASEDGTYDAMCEVAQAHENVNVVKLATRLFLGGARNQGLKAARGEYVWFVDADDLVAQIGCTGALHYAVENSLDVLGFEYCLIDYNGKLLRYEKAFKDYSIYSGITFAKNKFKGLITYHMGYVWRFLYRRNFLKERNIIFAEGVCWEDTVFMPKAIIEAKRVGAVEDRLYNYRQNPSGICGTMHRQYPAQLIYEFSFVAGKELLDYSLTIHDEQLKTELKNSANNKYLNGFLIFLLRTNSTERRVFYRMLHDNEQFEGIKSYLTYKSKILLSPIGRWLVEGMSYVYRLKH